MEMESVTHARAHTHTHTRARTHTHTHRTRSHTHMDASVRTCATSFTSPCTHTPSHRAPYFSLTPSLFLLFFSLMRRAKPSHAHSAAHSAAIHPHIAVRAHARTGKRRIRNLHCKAPRSSQSPCSRGCAPPAIASAHIRPFFSHSIRAAHARAPNLAGDTCTANNPCCPAAGCASEGGIGATLTFRHGGCSCGGRRGPNCVRSSVGTRLSHLIVVINSTPLSRGKDLGRPGAAAAAGAVLPCPCMQRATAMAAATARAGR